MSVVNLNTITFPVFKLGDKPNEDGGVIFYLYGHNTESEDAEYKVAIVDDKNIEEDSLAFRRLKMRERGDPMFNISKAIFFISDLLKLAKAGIWFIDKTGQIFEYKKTTRVPLIYKPITQVIPMNAGGAIIEVKDLACRFKTLFAPSIEQTHAGLLVIGHSFILYGLYNQKYDSTTRDI
jgi:hypothetical protein